MVADARCNMGSMALHDFTLPDADGGERTFDVAYRESHDALLFFYRGWW